MNQFDQLAKMQTAQQLAAYPSALSGPVLPPSTRPMNLTERVMTHDQRIAGLEEQIHMLREGMERLTQLLVEQLGLQI